VFFLLVSQILSKSSTEVSFDMALHCLHGVMTMFGNEFASFMLVLTVFVCVYFYVSVIYK